MPDITIGGVTLRFKGDRKDINASVRLTEKQLERLQQRHRVLADKQKADLKQLRTAYNAHNRELGKAATAFGNITRNVNTVGTAYRTQNTALGKATTATSNLSENLRNTSRTSGNLNRNIKNSQELFRSFNRELRRAVQVLAGLSAKQVQAAGAAKIAAQAQGNVAEATNKAAASAKSAGGMFGFLRGKLDAYGKRLNATKATTIGFDRSMIQILATLGQYAAATVLITGITATLGQVTFKAAADFEQAFIGVGKTVEGIVEISGQVTELGLRLQQQLFSISQTLPTSVEELSKIAELAGQLGVRGVSNISKFVDTVAKLDIATNLNFEQAAVDLGRFINVTGFNNPNALGSVIVRLGNNFATTESEILDYGKRLAGAGTSAGLAAHEILAFGAAASALGRLPESGATSIQVIFLEIFKAIQLGGEELKVFASIAGRTAEQFRTLFAQDPAAAITSFVRGFAADDALNLSRLGDIGITSRRLNATLLSFANNTELLTDALNQASEEVELASALGEEVAKFVSTFYSQLEILRNNLNLVAIEVSSNVVPGLTDMVKALNRLFESGKGATALIYVVSGVSASIASLFGLVFVFGRGLKVLGRIFGATSLATTKFGIGAGKIGLIVIGIGLLIDALVLLSPAIGKFINRLRGIKEEVENPVQANQQLFLDVLLDIEAIQRLKPVELSLALDSGELEDRIENMRQRFRNAFDTDNLGLDREPLDLKPLGLDPEFVERAESAFAKFTLRIRTLRNELQGFNTKNAVLALTDFRRAIGGDYNIIFNNIGEIAPRLRKIADDLGIEALNSLERAALAYDTFIQKITGQADDTGQRIIQQFHSQRIAAQQYEQSLGELITAFQGLNSFEQARSVSQLSDALRAVREEFQQFGNVERYVTALRNIGDAAREARENDIELADAFLSRLADQSLHREVIEEWQKTAEEIRKRAINRLRDAFGSFFERILQGTKSWGETFQRAIQALTAQLASLALQNLALRPLLDSLTQIGLFSRLGNIFGGGNVSTPVNFVGPPIPGAQGGGIHSGLTLVGEAGPELVNFRQPTRVTTNSDLREAVGSVGGYVFNFSPVIQTSDSAAIRKALSDAFPAFEKRIESIVGRNLSRPSSLRKNVTGR